MLTFSPLNCESRRCVLAYLIVANRRRLHSMWDTNTICMGRMNGSDWESGRGVSVCLVRAYCWRTGWLMMKARARTRLRVNVCASCVTYHHLRRGASTHFVGYKNDGWWFFQFSLFSSFEVLTGRWLQRIILLLVIHTDSEGILIVEFCAIFSGNEDRSVSECIFCGRWTWM